MDDKRKMNMAWISHQTLNHFETLVKQFEEIQQKYQARSLRKNPSAV
jgi:hypothetical protein